MSGVLLEDHKLTRTVFKHITATPLSSLPPTKARVRAGFILQQLQIHLPTKTPGRQPLKLLVARERGAFTQKPTQTSYARLAQSAR